MHRQGDRKTFFKTAKIGINARHKNVMKTIGAYDSINVLPIIVTGMQKLLVFFESFLSELEEMNLQQLCKSMRYHNIPLSPSLFLIIILDIAMGMNYLSLLDISHQDFHMRK